MLKKLLLLLLIITTFSYAQDTIYDPWEKYNRAIFEFNDELDINVAEPVARGYDYVTPQRVVTGVSNVFYNIEYPSRLVSDLVQLKFGQAALHTGRFLINSTLGIAGLIDVADAIGLKKHHEDLGTAFAYWGTGPGPYIVLPLLGPKNLRDVIGYCFDKILSPLFWVPYFDIASELSSYAVSIGMTTVDLINTRSTLLEVVETAKASALDYYLFSQSAYYQYRKGVIFDGNAPGQGDDWLEDDEDWLEE